MSRNQSQFRRISGRGRTRLACPVCSKEFSRPNAHLRGDTACCSQACSRTIKPKKPATIFNYTCQGCGSSFQQRKGYSGPADYCSRPCARKHTVPRGSAHHNWRGGVAERTHAAKRATRERLKEVSKCERCGSTGHLHGHHKLPYSTYPHLRADPKNIEILCIHCHAAEHPSCAALILSRAGISRK